jgi:energy-coupling factor transporter transmembrane protein EcfT
MNISFQILVIFAIIIITISFIYFIPIDIYYYSPLLISVIGAVLVGFLFYLEIKTFTKSTTSSLIAIAISVVLCIFFLQKYHNSLQTKLLNSGKKENAKVVEMQVKSGSFHEQHIIKYTYSFEGKEIKSSEIVSSDFYQYIENEQEIQILFLPEKPKISTIIKK